MKKPFGNPRRTPSGGRARQRRNIWQDNEPQARLTGAWRGGVLVSLPLVLIALAALGFGVARVLAPDPAAPVTPDAVLPDPLAALPADTRGALTDPDPVLPARLKLTFSGRPADLCAQLDELGLSNAGWRRALFRESRYQCASELIELTNASVDYGPATLFFLLRGPDAARIDYLRLKLVVDDPRQKAIGVDAVILVISSLSERYAWAVPPRFFDAIAEFKALEMADRGVRLSVAPEDPGLTGDPRASQRLNIILDFGEPELILPAAQFTAPGDPAGE
ncbi:MAG: hypothetical protein JJ902_14895 [Roseibium sp.]|nr:hypothetical protein [Roseibium sp.]